MIGVSGSVSGWRTLGVVCMCVCLAPAAYAIETVYPAADGTLLDGWPHGDFDGVADDADWAFALSGYQGNITLTTETPVSSQETRVVWEYDLSGVALEPPITATLTFTLRAVTVWGFPDTRVHVYAYPADLLETMDDFLAGPTVLWGGVTVVAFSGSIEHTLDVSAVVNDALIAGTDQVAFRFQVDPDTTSDRNQAFIDAQDADETTKPYLTIDDTVAGDYDDDHDVDLDDYAVFCDCLDGPGAPPTPELPGVTEADCLRVFDFDADTDVDLEDFSVFQSLVAEE